MRSEIKLSSFVATVDTFLKDKSKGCRCAEKTKQFFSTFKGNHLLPRARAIDKIKALASELLSMMLTNRIIVTTSLIIRFYYHFHVTEQIGSKIIVARKERLEIQILLDQFNFTKI